MRHNWTAEQDAWLLDRAGEVSASQLAKEFTGLFGVEATKDMITSRARTLRQGGEMVVMPRIPKISIEQAVRNNVKVARSLIRLRHSLLGDSELAEVLPKIRAKLAEQAANGLVTGLSRDEIEGLLGGAE